MAHIVMTPEEEAENLRETLAMLNDSARRLHDWQGKNYGYEDAVWLRRLVLAWKEAGHTIRQMKMRKRDRDRLRKYVETIHVTAQMDGELRIVDFYSGDAAAMNFTRLVRNSQKAKLGGPCGQCERWYVSKTQRETKYCSRKCAANAAKAKERRRKRDELMEDVRQATRNYDKRPTRFAEMPWKEFVTKAVPGVSKKLLTVAIQKGELRPPKKENKP